MTIPYIMMQWMKKHANKYAFLLSLFWHISTIITTCPGLPAFINISPTCILDLSIKQYSKISFQFVDGFKADYQKWLNGYRVFPCILTTGFSLITFSFFWLEEGWHPNLFCEYLEYLVEYNDIVN